MTKARLTLFDTTLRDGAQTVGVDFSLDDKRQIATMLDELGIDYIEGGYPGANPLDTEFFATRPPLKARFAAFGNPPLPLQVSPSIPGQPGAGPSRPIDPVVQSSARWFWWIAGLSLTNMALLRTGTNTQLVVGLGVSMFADVAFGVNNPVGLAVAVLAMGFFVLMGRQAQRGRLWAFYLGIAAYALDGLLYANYRDWMPVAFHGLIIYFISRGVLALRSAPA